MRVAMICPYSLSRPGGVQGQATGLARALRRRGHAVWLLAPAGAGTAREHLEHLGRGGTIVAGRPVPIPANGSVAPLALWPGAAARVRHEVQRLEVDVAHLHEPFAPFLGYGLLWHPVVPLVATFHRAGLGTGYRTITPIARRLGARIAVRCAVSESALSTAGEVVSGPFDLLFNGVDFETLSGPDTARSPGVRELPALRDAGPSGIETPPGAVPILFLGRHEPRKGLSILLEAFERIAEGHNAVLWIAGDGPMTAELCRRYPEDPRRRWLGVVGEEDKVCLLEAARVLCAPALGSESFGLVILEALAARTAVLASDIPGYRGAGGEHVELAAPGDLRQWVLALGGMVDDARALRGRSSQPALDAGAEHASGWSMERLAGCYEERYERAMRAR